MEGTFFYLNNKWLDTKDESTYKELISYTNITESSN